MKRVIILILLCFVLSSCASTKKNDFFKRKYQTETKKSYASKKGLMLLKNTQLGRNKYIHSNSYRKKLKQTKKRLRK